MISKDEISKKYSSMFADGWPNWFDFDDGWNNILDITLSLIVWDVKYNNMPKVELNQIKEKYGKLMIYFIGGNERTNGIIDMATIMSSHICEICGSTKDIGQTKGWIKTVCKDCVDKKNINNWKQYLY
jgi:hypothetical protein